MTTSLPVLFALALCAPAQAGREEALSPTGRVLRTPDPAEAGPAEEQHREADPWPYRGRLSGLSIVSMMWSNTDGVATLEDTEGHRFFVWVGSRLGAKGAEVVRIANRRVELVEYTDRHGLDGTWCRSVLEEVVEEIVIPPERPRDEPTIERRVSTQLHVVQCSLHKEHLDLPAQPAWAK